MLLKWHDVRHPGPAERVQHFLKAAQCMELRMMLTEATNQPLQQTKLCAEKHESPGRANDHIFPSEYVHKHQRPEDCKTCARWTRHGDPVCFDIPGKHPEGLSCDELGCVPGEYLLGSQREHSKIFFGPYVSGSGVMKSAHQRDKLVKEHYTKEAEALAIEMEGPGVWGTFPTMVVKGVVDYADSHKNKRWRSYPAARAALCTAQIIRAMDLGSYTPATGTESSASSAGNLASNEEKSRPREEEVAALRIKLYENTSNYDDQRSIYMARASNTCRWICDDYERVQSFLYGSEHRLLWISGHAGCGKSYIAAFLTERLEEVRGNIMCHYFLNPAGENPDTALRILCALLHQLCAHRRASHAAYNIYKGLARGDACLSELKTVWQMLCAAAAAAAVGLTPQKVFLCIDGLDQCSAESMMPFLKLIETELYERSPRHGVSEEKSSQVNNLRIMITSRPDPDITASLGQFAGCRVGLEGSQSVVQQDLEAVVSQRVAEYHGCDEELETFIKDTLLEQAGSTFLWIKVVCSRLGAAKHLNKYKVQCIVQDSPKDLDGLYAQMLQCEEADIHLTRTILHLVMAAAEPLSVDSLNLAVNIHASNVRLDQVKAEKDFDITLRKLCGSLLTISTRRVTFLHQTVSDFLTKGTHFIGEGTQTTLSLDTMEAQHQLASKCMVYLLLEEFGTNSTFHHHLKRDRQGDISKMLDSKHNKHGVQKGALFHYAASHWQTHFAVYDKSPASVPSGRDREAISRLLSPEHFDVWDNGWRRGLPGALDWVIRQHQTVMALIFIEAHLPAIESLAPYASILAKCARYDNHALLGPLYTVLGCHSSVWSKESLVAGLSDAVCYGNLRPLDTLLDHASHLQRKPSTGEIRKILCSAAKFSTDITRMGPCIEHLLRSGTLPGQGDTSRILQHEDAGNCPICVASRRGKMPILVEFDAFRTPLDLHAVEAAIAAGQGSVSERFLSVLSQTPESLDDERLTRCLRIATTTGQLADMKLLLQCLEKATPMYNDAEASQSNLPRSNKKSDLWLWTMFQTWVKEGLRCLVNHVPGSGRHGTDDTTCKDFEELMSYLAIEDGSLLAFCALRGNGDAVGIIMNRFGPDFDEAAIDEALLAVSLSPYLIEKSVVLAIHPADLNAVRSCRDGPSNNPPAGVVTRVLQQILALASEHKRQKDFADVSYPEDKAYKSWCDTITLLLECRCSSIPDWLWAGMLRPPLLGNMVKLLLQQKFILPHRLWPVVLTSCARQLDRTITLKLFHKYARRQTAAMLAESQSDHLIESHGINVPLDLGDMHLIQTTLLSHCQLYVAEGERGGRTPSSGSAMFVLVDLLATSEYRGRDLERHSIAVVNAWDIRRWERKGHSFDRFPPREAINGPSTDKWLSHADQDTMDQVRGVLANTELDAERFHQCLINISLRFAERRISQRPIGTSPSLFPEPLEHRARLSAFSRALEKGQVEVARNLICQQNVDVWHQSHQFQPLLPSALEQAVSLGLEDAVIAWVVRNEQWFGRPDPAGATLLHYLLKYSRLFGALGLGNLALATGVISQNHADLRQESAETVTAEKQPTLPEQPTNARLELPKLIENSTPTEQELGGESQEDLAGESEFYLALADKKLESARKLVSTYNVNVWQESDEVRALQQPTLLEQAVVAGLQTEVVAWVTHNNGFLIDKDGTGATILHYVAKHSATSTDIEALKVLCLKHRASIQVQDKQMQTPLDYARCASEGRETPAMDFLLRLTDQYNDQYNNGLNARRSSPEFDMQASDDSDDNFDSDASENDFGSDRSEDDLSSGNQVTTSDVQTETMNDPVLMQVGRLRQLVAAAEIRARRRLPF